MQRKTVKNTGKRVSKVNPRRVGQRKTDLKTAWNFLDRNGEVAFKHYYFPKIGVLVGEMLHHWNANNTFEEFWKHYAQHLRYNISSDRDSRQMKRIAKENPRKGKSLLRCANCNHPFFKHDIFSEAKKSPCEARGCECSNYSPKPEKAKRKNVSTRRNTKNPRKQMSTRKAYDINKAKVLYEVKYLSTDRNSNSHWILAERFVRRDNALDYFREAIKTRSDLNWRLYYGKRIAKEHSTKRNSKNPRNPETFNIDKLDKLSGIFQGHISGKQIITEGSDYTPPLTSRLGKLSYILFKNGRDVYEAKFSGDAWLSADARKNIYAEGRNARIKNAALPKKGGLTWLGEVQQVNYITNKSHIENGKTVEYYHELGEVDGIKPNAFLDHDGFIIFSGGNYDIDVNGIEN